MVNKEIFDERETNNLPSVYKSMEKIKSHPRGEDILEFCRKWISLPMDLNNQKLITEEIKSLKLDPECPNNECLGSHIVNEPIKHMELKFMKETEFTRLVSLYFLCISRVVYTLMAKV